MLKNIYIDIYELAVPGKKRVFLILFRNLCSQISYKFHLNRMNGLGTDRGHTYKRKYIFNYTDRYIIH